MISTDKPKLTEIGSLLSVPYCSSSSSGSIGSSSGLEHVFKRELPDVKPSSDIFDIDWSKVKVQVFNSLQLQPFQNLSTNPFSSPVNVDFLLENMKRMERIPKRGRPKGRFSSSGGIGSGSTAGSSRQPIASTSSSSSDFKVPEVAKLFGCPYCSYSSRYAFSIYPHVRKQHNGRKVYCIDFPI